MASVCVCVFVRFYISLASFLPPVCGCPQDSRVGYFKGLRCAQTSLESEPKVGTDVASLDTSALLKNKPCSGLEVDGLMR